MPPPPPEFHGLQGLHPGLHRSLGPQNFCVGKGPYWAVGNFLYDIFLVSWRLDKHFPESLSTGRALWTGNVWPWKVSGRGPVRLTQQMALCGFLDQRNRNYSFWKCSAKTGKSRRLILCRRHLTWCGDASTISVHWRYKILLFSKYSVSTHCSASIHADMGRVLLELRL